MLNSLLVEKETTGIVGVMKYENKLSWITVEMIEKHLDNPWDSDFISRNPNITMEIIEKYPDKPWDWNHM